MQFSIIIERESFTSLSVQVIEYVTVKSSKYGRYLD